TVTMGWLVERVPAIVLSHTIDVRIRVSRYEAVTDANRWIEAKEAHEAVRDLRATIRDAREEMRQTGKAEARKHLAKQMRAAAEILARDP
ncbi:MAG: hypothetical protein M3P85_07410, partial [Actinomycetota bacterium]|nr:hypothetical protein [Actinomycetota bacterium]